MGTILSNTLETVAPIKLKKVRGKRAAPWYNSYTHSLKKETRNLECKWRKTNLEVFRIAWKNSMSSYRQALKAARTEHIRKLIDNNQNNPRFLFSTVARLTNNQTSPDLNIPSQFNSNDFMNFFTDKIDNIRNTITNVDSTASSTSASFTARVGYRLVFFDTGAKSILLKRCRCLNRYLYIYIYIYIYIHTHTHTQTHTVYGTNEAPGNPQIWTIALLFL